MSNTEIAVFKPKAVKEYGNGIMLALVQHDALTDAAKEALAQSEARNKVIDFELTRVMLHLHTKEEIDINDIFSDNRKDVAAFYTRFMVATGAKKREFPEGSDVAVYSWTSDDVADAYDYNTALKEADKDKWAANRSRMNTWNARLSRAAKAAVVLNDSGTKHTDMKVTEVDGEQVATISKGPDELMGSTSKPLRIEAKAGVKPAEGATITPTIQGLAKLATAKNKGEESSAATNGQATNKDVASSEDLVAMANALVMALRTREGNFEADEKKALAPLKVELDKVVS